VSRSKPRRKSSPPDPSRRQPKPPATQPAVAIPERHLDLAICLGLILSIFAVYAQVGHFDFIHFDDQDYVYENVHVKAGLAPASIKWAFTAVVSANWMPVTLLSHMLDVQFFGLRSGMHHLVNVLFHALSALLLFMVLRRATRARWPSAFVAFVFALHPLHVESVAWISERKDVLSAFFFFLALYAYVRYTERPGLGRYLAVLGLFCLGLMSKPMLVTFPFTLLLFDIWPLGRVQWPKILWEKLPLFALSAGSSVVTYFTQRSITTVLAAPLAPQNALLSYVTYIRQMFWPVRLAIFYPYPRSIEASEAAAAGAVILSVSALAIYLWRVRPRVAPYFITGWFWYLGTLVPVIGLVQVGRQSHADRYTYIPMVGLLMILAWGAADVVGKWPRTKPAIAAAATISCIVCMAAASAQAAYWRNGVTLFQHALDVTEDNLVAESSLGYHLMKAPGRCPDAIPHFEAALRINPDDVETDANLGFCLMQSGRPTDAIPYFEAVLRANPDSAEAHNNLGLALSQTPGRDADAIPHFEAVLRAQPDSADTNNNLGACLVNSGRPADAVPYFEAALRTKPDSADIQFNLGMALSKTPGRDADAISHLEAALRLRPDHVGAHHNLALLLVKRGRTEDAIAHLEAAIRLNPNYQSERELGAILSTIPGRQSDAVAHLEAAQRLHPDPEVAKTIARLRALR
jgi:tetratricopeptide (TPR) repeat protein